MKDYIVKIRTYHGQELIQSGTGIVISSSRIVTAAHVVLCGDRHSIVIEEEEIVLNIARHNTVLAVLSAETLLPFTVADIFSVDEILDLRALWTVCGYITNEQCPHRMTGSGFVYDEGHDTSWDYTLTTIESGQSFNYEGLSGAPVFSCGRIVGILQAQAPNSNGRLGVRMASVGMFQDLLSTDVLKPNEYETLILEESQKFSHTRVEENKKSRKYIPDIFVEEGLHKEQLRYFAEPYLFVKKAIRNYMSIDFSVFNRYLSDRTLPMIDFSDLSDEFSHNELDDVTQILLNHLSNTITVIQEYRHFSEKKGLGMEQYSSLRCTANNFLEFYLENLHQLVKFAPLRYVLLTKQAGQGKTNFLCDFTQNFLLKKGYCVWYFNANELRENPLDVIQRKLNLHRKYEAIYIKQVLENMWKKTGKPVIIVIDALNENTAIPDFGNCVCDFLDECSSMPYLKVIMSTREELLKERFGCLLQLEDETQIAFAHLDMKNTNDDFKERIFYGYLNFFDIEIRYNTLRQQTYNALTEDILLLRFFCEVNEHKKQLYMYDVYKYDVFTKYLNKKAMEYQQYDEVVEAGALFYSLLDHICKYMVDEKMYFHVPLTIFDRNEQLLLKQMLENDVIFKSEADIETGILQQKGGIISFTFDEFRDFCLTNYILKYYSKKEDFLNFWSTMEQEDQTIREGVQKYIFYLSKTNYRDKLLPIVQELAEYEILYWEYIWDVEDQYISEMDIVKWREQMLESGKHAAKVVNHLLFKYDCTYSPKVNIKLLFEALNELSPNTAQYHRFITTMFGVTRLDKYGMEQCGSKTLWPFNKMLKKLRARVENTEWVLTCIEWFRLVVYLYELSASHAQALWDTLYRVSPNQAVGLLQEMNRHESALIKGNVKDILLGLQGQKRNDKYDSEINCLIQENDFGQDMIGAALAIAEIFSEGS